MTTLAENLFFFFRPSRSGTYPGGSVSIARVRARPPTTWSNNDGENRNGRRLCRWESVGVHHLTVKMRACVCVCVYATRGRARIAYTGRRAIVGRMPPPDRYVFLKTKKYVRGTDVIDPTVGGRGGEGRRNFRSK